MATLAILKSLHTLDNRQFVKGLSESQRRSRKTSRVISGHARNMTRRFRGLTSGVFSLQSAIGVLAGSAGIGLLVRNQMQAIQTTQRLTKVSGFQSRTIEALKIQARDYGVEQERVNDAVIDFSERLGEARTGTGEAVDGFELLEEASGRQLDLGQNVNAVWREFVTMMGEVSDESTRAAIAAQIGGDALRDIIPVISEGGEGFEEAARQAERFGLSFDRLEAEKIRDANEAIAEMQSAFEGVTRELTIELAPFIESAAQEITHMSQNTIDFEQVFVNVGGTALKIIGALADGVRGVRIALKAWQVIAAGFAAVFHVAIGSVVTGMADVIDAINGMVNEAIKGFNKIPGIDIALIPSAAETDFVKRFKSIAQIAFDRVGNLRGELQDMMMEPLPSESINQFIQRIRERAANREMPSGNGADGDDGDGGGENAEDRQTNIFAEMLQRRRNLEREHQEKLRDMRASSQGRLLQQHLQFLDMMEAADDASGKARVGIVSNALAQMTAEGAQHNRELFELNRAAAIANAIISTEQGAAKALEWGWPMGPIFAGIIWAAGAARINAIRSQSFSGGGGGAAPSTTAGGGVPAVQDVSGQGQAERPQQNVTIDIAGGDDRLLSKRQLRRLMEEMQEELGDDASIGTVRIA